ncbi:TIR domain-containing protein [Desulfococcaceae bacterium HSG7]|nr:TIR domain-containing protein [Desulfococcaceae bacterium HSG7]
MDQAVKKYDVFISYASEYSFFAKILFNVLKRAGLRVWFDKKAMKAGDLLDEEIKKGIKASSKMIAIWAPEYFEKKWPIFETEIKIDSDNSTNQHTLIPIWLKGCELPAKYHELLNIISIDIATESNFLSFFKELLKALEIQKDIIDNIEKIIEWEKNSCNSKNEDEKAKKELIKICQLLEYEVEDNSLNSKTKNDFIIENKWGSASIFKAGFRFYDKFISYDDYDLLWDLLLFFKELPDEYRKIVLSSEGFKDDIKKDLDNSGFQCVTFYETLQDLFPFNSYKTFLSEAFMDKENQYYWGDKDLFVEPFLKTEKPDESVLSIKYINNWIKNDQSNALLLLGNLGAGKTTLIKYIINEYLNNFALEQIDNKPFPLLISLGDIRRKASLEEIIMQHLNEVEKTFEDDNQNINLTYKRIKYLIDAGKIILFFDAFDEMAYKMNWEMKSLNFNQLLSACNKKGKVIITCRTHYFKNESEQKKNINKTTPLYRQYKKLKNSEVAYLEEFNNEKIIEYMQKRRIKSWKEDLEKIKMIFREKEIEEKSKKYRIPHLAHRPLLLNMIVGTLDKNLNEMEGRTPVNLYKRYINMWLEREEHLKQRNIILKHIKLKLMMKLSWRLWNENKKSIHHSELAIFIEESDAADKVGLGEAELKLWLRDTMTASFLKRDAQGNFSFMHYSFLEFFVAKRLYYTIKEADANAIYKILSKRRFGKIIIYFLTLLDRKTRIVMKQLKFILTGQYQRKISENALKILYWYARTDCNMENAIDDMVKFKEKTARLMPKNANLSGAKLEGLNLEGAYLYKADLREADLKMVTLNNAVLTAANFNNANLSEAQLENTYAENATFREAVLDNTNFQKSDLLHCDFTGAIKLTNTDFKDANHLDLNANRNIIILQPIVQRAHCNEVESFAYDNRKFLCASGGEDGLVVLYRVRDKRILWVFEGHTDVVNAVAFSRDDQLIASGSGDRTLRIWDVMNLQCRYVFRGHKDVVNTVAFSPDGKWVASGSADRSIKICDLYSGEIQRTIDDQDAEVISVRFSDDSKSITGITRTRKRNVWDVRNGRLLEKQSDVSISENKTELQKDELLWLQTGHRSGINTVSFSKSGKMLVSVSRENKSIRLRNLETLTMFRHIGNSPMNAVAFSPDETMLAGAGADNKLRLWDVKSGEELVIFEAHTNEVSSVAFSANGKILISGSLDNTICLWDVRRGTKMKQFEYHKDWVRSVACSPEDNILASGSWDFTIRLWDLEKKELIKILNGHTNRVITVAFSSDGKRLVSGSRDKTVRIWDVATGKQLYVMRGHTDSVKSADFAHDGKTIASGSTDNTVRLWDADSGKHIATLEGNLGHVYSVKFEPNGKYLVSAGEAGRLQFWDYKSRRSLLYSYCFGRDKWLNLLPDKRFDASETGINYLGFIEKNKLRYQRASEPEIKNSFFAPEAVRNVLASM